jgi:hypothetical protein
VELFAEFSKLLGYKNHRNQKWAVCENSDCSTDWTKDVSNETVTLKTETREEIFDPVSERFFSNRLLLSIHYFIWPNLIIRCNLTSFQPPSASCCTAPADMTTADSVTAERGGVLGSLMEPLYCVTAWDYYKRKTQQQHIKQFNIHTQHLPTVRRAFCRPQCGVQNGSQQQHRVYVGILWAVGSLQGVLWANRSAAIGWLVEAEIGNADRRGGGPWLEEL